MSSWKQQPVATKRSKTGGVQTARTNDWYLATAPTFPYKAFVAPLVAARYELTSWLASKVNQLADFPTVSRLTLAYAFWLMYRHWGFSNQINK